MTRKQAINLAVGLGLLVVVSLPPLELLRTDLPRLYPSPKNAWLGPVFLLLIGSFAAASVVLLLRGISWAYCAWAQSVISVIVFISWYGFLRREESFRRYVGPDDLDRLAPAATWSWVLVLALAGVIIGFLPLALRALLCWRKAHGNRSKPCAEVAPGADANSGAPPDAS